MHPPFSRSDNNSEDYLTIHSKSDFSCHENISRFKYQLGGKVTVSYESDKFCIRDEFGLANFRNNYMGCSKVLTK